MRDRRRRRSVIGQSSLAPILVSLILGGAGCAANSSQTHLPQTAAADPAWIVVSGVNLVSARGESDCGPAALKSVIGYWRPHLTPADLDSSVAEIASAEGSRAGDMRTIAERQGLHAFLVEAKLDDLNHEIERQRPVIIGVLAGDGSRRSAHYEVVTGINRAGTQVLIADPKGTWQTIDTTALMAEWNPTRNLALVIFP